MNNETAFEQFLKTERGQQLIKSVNQPEPYNKNVLWWAYTKGYEQAIEDDKNQRLYNATKRLTTASERRKSKIKLSAYKD